MIEMHNRLSKQRLKKSAVHPQIVLQTRVTIPDDIIGLLIWGSVEAIFPGTGVQQRQQGEEKKAAKRSAVCVLTVTLVTIDSHVI